MEPVAPKGKEGQARTKLSVNLDDNLLAWINARVGAGKEFDSVRHAIERGIRALMELEK